ncbi:NAD-P-binding protein [Tilletiaria anomala UBC 951]|uniref:NAD-P-binding protein n=1 Tax=Tilletiaria anomala (strain ATCC 24038 / CBS 436.72 / UBC 951) TaxID=1037660 RepID=A0A066W095_TILAU|nr:NAD-P-binding protein [Tilletiaria anomala UBC 951]KDN45958.1 NAD-P-binding protein [Tilletiaria anomala UBC 951]
MSSPALKNFFRADRYSVVGASKDPEKFGNKVLKWYIARGLQVTPVHPKEAEIESLATVKEVGELPSPTRTSLSLITPPKVTLPIVQKALQEYHFPTVWLQPGAESPEFLDWLRSQDQATQDRVIVGGPCILVQGDILAREQGRM